MSESEIEKYEAKCLRISRIRGIIDNLIFVIDYENKNRCKWCNSKINLKRIKNRIVKLMKLNNEFSPSYQYMNINDFVHKEVQKQ